MASTDTWEEWEAKIDAGMAKQGHGHFGKFLDAITVPALKPSGKCAINSNLTRRASVGIHGDFIRVFDFHTGVYYDLPAKQAWQLHDELNNKGKVNNNA